MIKRSSDKIKREKRKAFFLKEISQMLRDLSEDEPVLIGVFPTRVEFSQGNGMCYVYFSCHSGKEGFSKVLDTLKLYKPSLRKGLANVRHSRYTPDAKFLYDESFEKSQKMEELLDEIKDEIKDETD